ncbi:hypothetical protein AAFF_G00057100 [Aldrovandia affinis]|uniref:Uncharacterized protein n=1 Tax=Aldrovandia affinis TaxID=143900 RepID=A0AAD7WEM1_9TELE|nr:hypothetical protein AAFF_G00057100 [Aldrovandia affinis]
MGSNTQPRGETVTEAVDFTVARRGERGGAVRLEVPVATSAWYFTQCERPRIARPCLLGSGTERGEATELELHRAGQQTSKPRTFDPKTKMGLQVPIG